MTDQWSDCFDLEGFRVLVERNKSGAPRSEASIRLRVGEEIAHTASEGSGPVHALDLALRKALRQFYPEIDASSGDPIMSGFGMMTAVITTAIIAS